MRGELSARGLGPAQELLVAGGAEATACVRDALELALDLLEPPRLRLEGREEAAERGGHLLEPLLYVPEVDVLGLELGSEVRHRHEGVRRLGELVHRTRLALFGGERLCRIGGGLGQLGDVAEPLAFRAEGVLRARHETLGPLDELPQLLEPLGAPRFRARELVPMPAGGRELPPGACVVGTQTELLLADERVEDVELERRPREAPLLELARHREQPLHERRKVLPRDCAAPGVGSGAAVGEDPPRRDEPGLFLRPELGEGGELLVLEDPVREIEVRLDVRLARARPEVAGVPGRAEEEPDRLGEDRLAGPGLPGDRVQARPEAQVGLADEDEVLDAQAAEHWV